MQQCIYFKDKIDLTFNDREHIFPKAIGGTIRLENGIVSDQANEFFANNLEIKTFRSSHIYIGRFIHQLYKKPSKEKNKNRKPPEYVENREIDSRTLAKISFNVLAKLKGKEYVLSSKFDEFRNWILKGKNDWYHCKMGDELLIINRIVPPHAHSCTFVNNNEYLIADICLFNYWRKMFPVCKKFDNLFNNPIGYICDWKNKLEFTLLDLMHEIAKEEDKLYLLHKK